MKQYLIDTGHIIAEALINPEKGLSLEPTRAASQLAQRQRAIDVFQQYLGSHPTPQEMVNLVEAGYFRIIMEHIDTKQFVQDWQAHFDAWLITSRAAVRTNKTAARFEPLNSQPSFREIYRERVLRAQKKNVK